LKFSEQYVVDCGPMTSDKLAGCNGGLPNETGQFVQNFGLELASNYPYTASDGTCPYHPRAEMTSMGHLRADMAGFVSVGLAQMEHYPAFAPVIVMIYCPDNFDFYGGGVYDGKGCWRRGQHAVLIVGHGREDGEEYWLIRNSFGRTWGEDGHMKLNKNSDCIHPRAGTIFGSEDGRVVKLGLHRNEQVLVPVDKARPATTPVLLPVVRGH
jgi:C1A family cysteine protease